MTPMIRKLAEGILAAWLGAAAPLAAQEMSGPPSAAALVGTVPCANMPALTGNVTSSAASCGTTLAAGSASNLNSGTLPAGRMPALTGDVTSSAGAVATTLAAGSAANLNSGTLPSGRLSGSYTGVTGVGTLLAGGTGAGFTLDFTNSTLSGGSGSGTVARVTGPTLSAPNLGTPASGTGTNLSGVPIGSGVSGLAANVATFLGTPNVANLAAALTDESGSWTPAVAATGTAGTPAYTTQVGDYVIHPNKEVTVTFFIVLSGWTGSPTGNVNITGLPITSNATANHYGTCVLSYYTVTGLPASNYGIVGYVANGGTTATLQTSTTAGTTAISTAQMGTTPTLVGKCTYPI